MTGQQQRRQIGLARAVGIGRRSELGHQVVRGAGDSNLDVDARHSGGGLDPEHRFDRRGVGEVDRPVLRRRTCSFQERAAHLPSAPLDPRAPALTRTLITRRSAPSWAFATLLSITRSSSVMTRTSSASDWRNGDGGLPVVVPARLKVVQHDRSRAREARGTLRA